LGDTTQTITHMNALIHAQVAAVLLLRLPVPHSVYLLLRVLVDNLLGWTALLTGNRAGVCHALTYGRAYGGVTWGRRAYSSIAYAQGYRYLHAHFTEGEWPFEATFEERMLQHVSWGCPIDAMTCDDPCTDGFIKEIRKP